MEKKKMSSTTTTTCFLINYDTVKPDKERFVAGVLYLTSPLCLTFFFSILAF